MIPGRGLLAGLLDRELGANTRRSVPSSYMHAFSCSGQQAGVIKVDPDGDPCPPYSITYNQAVQGCRLLTVGDEEGCVSLVDTSADSLPYSLYTDTANPPRAKWLAHNNTIFDMAWAKNDSVLYTASGDQHVGVWDAAAGRLRVYCAGHDGSVKVVAPHSSTQDVLASGSRDGGILLWDLRLPATWSAARRRMQLGPVGRISITTPAAHHHTSRPPGTAATPGGAAAAAAGGAPGSGSGRTRAPSSSRGARGGGGGPARRSVTSLLFLPQDGHSLVSSSDMDGTVKLWDLRSLTTPTADITLPPAAAAAAAAAGGEGGGGRGRGGRGGGGVGGAAAWLSFSCPGRTNRPAGVTSMALSPCGSLLLVSSIDSTHYLYRLSQLDGPPVACFRGHRAGSFCVKACFSPCGQHLLSGSSDGKAYVWQVSDPSLPPATLCGHTGEVTAVAWCPQDYCQLATAADDATVRVWALDRSSAAYARAFDHHNYSFADARADPLWARFGMGGAAAAGTSTAPLEANLQGLQLQQQQGQVEAVSGSRAKDPAVVGPSRGAAAAAGGSGGRDVGALEGGAAAGGEDGVTPLRGARPHPQHSICSPTTPQLPFWRANAAAAAPPAAAAPEGTAAGGGAGADADAVHPLAALQGIGAVGGGQAGGVGAAVDSSQPDQQQPDDMMDAQEGPAAGAGGAAGVSGCVRDAASFFTPTRQPGPAGQQHHMLPPPPQQHHTPAGPTAAAAAAAGPAAASTGKGGAAGRRSAGKRGGGKAAAAAGAAAGRAGRGKGATAGKTPDGLRQLTLTEQLAAAAATSAKRQQPLQTPAGAAATPAAEAGVEAAASAAAPAAEQPHTNPAATSPGAVGINPVEAAYAAAHGRPWRPSNSGRMWMAAFHAGFYPRHQGSHHAAAAPVAAAAAGATPCSLLRQVQGAQLADTQQRPTAAPQQQQQGEGSAGAACSSGSGSAGLGGGAGGRVLGGAEGCGPSSAVRLLHDEFEVFCDDDSQAAAAAAAAGATAGAECMQKPSAQEAAAGAGQQQASAGCSSRRAARRRLGVDVSQPPPAAAAAGGDGGSGGLLSPSCGSLLSPSGPISCQENLWLPAAPAGTAAAAAAAGAGALLVCDSPMDVDVVPCSLPPEQQLEACGATQQHSQQQQQQQPGVDDAQQQQQAGQGVLPSRGGGRVLLPCHSLPLPPKVAEVLGVSRRPLGDLSPLLLPGDAAHQPLSQAAAASPPPLAAATGGSGGVGCVLQQQQQQQVPVCGLRAGSLSPGALAGVGRLTRTRLGLGERSSPVRVLQMGGGGGAGSSMERPGGLSQGQGARAAWGSSLLHMLGQGQPHQQQCGGGALRGAAGMLLSGSSHSQQQQQQQGGYHHQHCSQHQAGPHFLSPQRLAQPCSPLKPKQGCSPDGIGTGGHAGGGDGYMQHDSGRVHSSGDGVPRKRSRLGECTPDKLQRAGLSFSERLAAEAAATAQQQQQQQPQGLACPAPPGQPLEALPEDHSLPSQDTKDPSELSGQPAGFLDQQAAALQQQQQHNHQQEEGGEESHGEAGEEAGAAGRKGAAASGGLGGIRRSAVAHNNSTRKRQCRLADLWAAKQPEVEDGASRFSGY